MTPIPIPNPAIIIGLPNFVLFGDSKVENNIIEIITITTAIAIVQSNMRLPFLRLCTRCPSLLLDGIVYIHRVKKE